MRCGVVWGRGGEKSLNRISRRTRKEGLRCVCVVLCCGAGQRGRDIRTLRRVGVRLGIGMCGARMDAIFLKEKKKFL